MSIENIKAFSIIGLEKELDNVVDVLGNSGVFHPDDVANFYTSTKGFSHIPPSNNFVEPYTKILNTINLLEIKEKYVDISDLKLSLEDITCNVDDIYNQAKVLTDAKKELFLQLNECNRAIEEAKHFINIDCNINDILNMRYVKSFLGRLPKNNIKKLNKYKDILLEFISATEENDYIWGIFLTPTSSMDTAQRILNRLHFEPTTFGQFDDTPSNKLSALKEELKVINEKFDASCKEYDKYISENKEKIIKYYTKLSQYNLFNSIRTKAMLNNNNFCLVGWVPAKNAKKLKSALKKISSVEVYVSNGKTELELSPPVKIKSWFLARPFQYYTEMYGVPKYNEIDPTNFIAITYILLFGIMFGDVGHGLVLAMAGFIMWKFKDMPIGKILLPCGLSGALFGLLFGSVFGFEHALDGMYKSLFGLKEKPIHVMAPTMTNTIIYVAVGIGMVLLMIAMLLNVYSSIKQGNIGKAIFDTSGICGLVFYGMICTGLAMLLVFSINLFSPIYISIIATAFLLVFLREPLQKLVNKQADWQPESWGGFIIENLFESIEVLLSYVTNTMSFLRVGAFVLVHAGMMEVVFILAQTAGGVGYWLVLIIGNIFVCVLEALLVAIQVLRLEYYEMFSRFYSGEGRPYEPVKLKITK